MTMTHEEALATLAIMSVSHKSYAEHTEIDNANTVQYYLKCAEAIDYAIEQLTIPLRVYPTIEEVYKATKDS